MKMYKSERRAEQFEKNINNKKYHNHSNINSNQNNFDGSNSSAGSFFKSLFFVIFGIIIMVIILTVQIIWIGIKYIKSIIIQKKQENIQKEKQISILEQELTPESYIWVGYEGDKIINSEKEVKVNEEKNDIWIDYTE